ncbi:MAG: DUF815 domain-containing protein [SAR324 cluster bacterium]|nr:DUF815 domain-containing protein [SAR324 cluster bacterium]
MNQKKPNLDESAFADFIQTLLDQISKQLDQYYSLGLPVHLGVEPIFRLYFEMLKELEEELLIQWKVKDQQGSGELLDYQKKWYLNEVRQEAGVFSQWALFAHEIQKQQKYKRLHPNPWASFVLGYVTDKQAMSPFINEGDPKNLSLKKVLTFLLSLVQIDPEHQFTSFLNLVEVGAKQRPDPAALGRFEVNQNDLKGDSSEGAGESSLQSLAKELAKKPGVALAIDLTQAFWEANSGGEMGFYSAFTLVQAGEEVTLAPIAKVRDVKFVDLFGMAEQEEKLTRNIELFLKGQAAHNCLLWGAKGMGKSSSVLALLNEYQSQGLRLVEMEQGQLSLLGDLFQILQALPEKFIVYIDDLSFEADSESFNFLKSKLQGSLCQAAKNVILVATANRKDLVFQKPLDLNFPSERQRVEEERALDDRFALKIYYPPAKFKKLEELFCFYAEKTLQNYDFDSLYKEFLNFAQFNDHDQPSGRSVVQFFESR